MPFADVVLGRPGSSTAAPSPPARVRRHRRHLRALGTREGVTVKPININVASCAAAPSTTPSPRPPSPASATRVANVEAHAAAARSATSHDRRGPAQRAVAAKIDGGRLLACYSVTGVRQIQRLASGLTPAVTGEARMDHRRIGRPSASTFSNRRASPLFPFTVRPVSMNRVSPPS